MSPIVNPRPVAGALFKGVQARGKFYQKGDFSFAYVLGDLSFHEVPIGIGLIGKSSQAVLFLNIRCLMPFGSCYTTDQLYDNCPM